MFAEPIFWAASEAMSAKFRANSLCGSVTFAPFSFRDLNLLIYRFTSIKSGFMGYVELEFVVC